MSKIRFAFVGAPDWIEWHARSTGRYGKTCYRHCRAIREEHSDAVLALYTVGSQSLHNLVHALTETSVRQGDLAGRQQRYRIRGALGVVGQELRDTAKKGSMRRAECLRHVQPRFFMKHDMTAHNTMHSALLHWTSSVSRRP